MDPESALSYKSDDEGRIETVSAVFDWTSYIKYPFYTVAGLYQTKIINLLHSNDPDKEPTWGNLKSMNSNNELVRESSSRMLKDDLFVKEE